MNEPTRWTATIELSEAKDMDGLLVWDYDFNFEEFPELEAHVSDMENDIGKITISFNLAH